MYEVIPTERFEKDVKYYVKKKGFVHIGTDIKAIRKSCRNRDSRFEDCNRRTYI